MLRLSVASVVALAALGACAGATRVFNVSQIPAHRADIARAAVGGTQSVEVLGAPADGASPETIAAAMRAPAGNPQTRYVAAAPGGGGLRIVLEFGAFAGQESSCRAPGGSRLAAGAPMQVAATLCLGSGLVSAATLSAPDVDGPSSPGFDSAMVALLRELLTPEPRDRGRDRLFIIP